MMEHAPDAREALLCWFQLNEGVAHAFRAKRLLEKPASFAALTNHSVKGGRSRKEAREKQIKKVKSVIFLIFDLLTLNGHPLYIFFTHETFTSNLETGEVNWQTSKSKFSLYRSDVYV